ncbi:MAG: tetratricopeptide repeat protein [Deltaproteobacteria bacterium]|nr:tetratricopeptide repeat protein [Deltaproteobacteria bacterium]
MTPSKRILLASCIFVFLGACVTGPSQKDIKQAEIRYDLGVGELHGGQFRQALRSFMAAVKVHPDFALAHNGLGLAYMVMGQNQLAETHLKRALELKPDLSEVLNNLARLYMNQKRFRQAIPLLEKALEDMFLKERYLAESNLGWALFMTGKQKKGMDRVMTALAQNEKLCVGYLYLGLMYEKRKQYDKSVEELQQLVEYCPDYPEGLFALAKVLLLQGNIRAGCRHLASCRDLGRRSQTGRSCQRLIDQNCEASTDP